MMISMNHRADTINTIFAEVMTAAKASRSSSVDGMRCMTLGVRSIKSMMKSPSCL